MNDDFLRNLRRPPSAAFERQLRERLREQELNETSRRRPGWKLPMIAMLVGGTALATATYLTMHRAPSVSSPAAQVTSAENSETTRLPPSTTGQQSSQWWGSADDTLSPEAPLTSPSAASGQQTSATSSARASDGASADAPPTGGARSGGALSVPGSQTNKQRLIRIVVTPDIEAIAKATVPWTVNPQSVSFEVDDAAAALRALCIGSAGHAEIAITSRRITKDELNVCNAPAVGGFLEATLGHVAVVVTRAQTGSPMELSSDAVMRALLKRIPSPEDPSRLIDNPYTRWNQIDSSLEDRRIEVFGPARDATEFHVLAAALLKPACDKYPSIQALQHTDRAAYEEICFDLREDGVYNEARFDNTFIRQRLWSDPNIVALVDYPFYSANRADLLGSLLSGAPATRESILNGNYAATRTLYFYVPRWRYERLSTVRLLVNDYLRYQFSRPRALLPSDGNTDGPPSRGPIPLTEVK